MDVATDTCILINLIVVGRLDLLRLVPPYIFHAASEVLNEIEDLDQRTAVEQAIAAGHFDEVKLDQPGELSLYVGFNATLGKGESACLALGKARGWAIATDESKDPKWKKVISGAGFAIINTPGILLAAILAGALTVTAADAIKAKLEQRRFNMKFDSFASLI
jgi:predicted nucleic acid-binding protein